MTNNDDATRALREVGADILRLKQTIADLNAENERLRENIRVRDEADALTIARHSSEVERLRAVLERCRSAADMLGQDGMVAKE